jgi:hypothetical protein
VKGGVRRYGISRFGSRSVRRWDVQGGKDIEPGFAESVTAYDARDVAPLVAAAARALGELEDIHAPGAGVLRDALEPFSTQPDVNSAPDSSELLKLQPEEEQR